MSFRPISSSSSSYTPPTAWEGTTSSSSSSSVFDSSSEFDDGFGTLENSPWGSPLENPWDSPFTSPLHSQVIDAPALLGAGALLGLEELRDLVSPFHGVVDNPFETSQSEAPGLSATHSVDLPPKDAPLEGSSYLTTAKYFAKIGGLALSIYKGVEYIAPALTSRGICLGKMIPVDLLRRLQRVMAPIASLPYRIYSHLFGGNPTTIIGSVIIAPVYEELEFRYILQHLILKKIPKSILEKVAPNYADIMDKLPVQILRVFVVSLFFTAVHASALTCEPWGGWPQFFAGVLTGVLNEMNDGNLLDGINYHAFNNLLCALDS